MRRLRIIHKQPVTEETSLDIDAARMIKVEHVEGMIKSGLTGILLCDVRVSGEFNQCAIYLDGNYDWAFGEDSDGVVCVVPLEKL